MDKEKSLLESVVSGTIWIYLTTYSGKFIVFLSTIVLARLLLKEDFGVAGYAITIIGFLNVINDFGLSTAIIYFPESKQTSNASFAINVLMGLSLLGLTWLLAPNIGQFFGDDRAISVTRALALTLPILALGNTHDALLRKEMKFAKKALPDTIKLVTKGLLSIGLALLGFGYWSLIIGQIVGSLLWVIALWWVMPWRPTLVFDLRKLSQILGYSFNVFAVSALATIFTNADYLLIGRYMGATALGIYTIAFRLPELLIQEFPIIVGNALLPAFSKVSTHAKVIETNILTSIRYSMLITLPMGIGLTLLAKPFTLFVFSDKWAESIPVMALIGIQMTLVSLVFNFGLAYKVQGRPEILTRLVMLRLTVLLPALWWAASHYGTVTAVALVHVAVGLLTVIMDIAAAVHFLNMRLKDIFAAYTPAVTASSGLIGALLCINYLMSDRPPLAHLLVAVCVGGLVYCCCLYCFQKDTAMYIEQSLRSTFKRA